MFPQEYLLQSFSFSFSFRKIRTQTPLLMNGILVHRKVQVFPGLLLIVSYPHLWVGGGGGTLFHPVEIPVSMIANFLYRVCFDGENLAENK